MTYDLDYIYGSISEEYCLYFYVLSVVGFILLLLVIINTGYSAYKKKYPMYFYINMVILAIIYGMFYLQNRLLYNMCSGEIQENGIEGYRGGGRSSKGGGLGLVLVKLFTGGSKRRASKPKPKLNLAPCAGGQQRNPITGMCQGSFINNQLRN